MKPLQNEEGVPHPAVTHSRYKRVSVEPVHHMVMAGLQEGQGAGTEGYRQRPFGLDFSGYHKLRNVCMESSQEWSTGGFHCRAGGEGS